MLAKTERYIEREINDYESSPKFVAESLALTVAEQVAELLLERGMNQTDLAGAMGVSRSHVSSILNAPPNMTLLTLARLGIALQVVVNVGLHAPGHIMGLAAQPSEMEDAIITANDDYGSLYERPRITQRQFADATT